MEAQIAGVSVSDAEFLKLLQRCRRGDGEAFRLLLDLFEPEMSRMSAAMNMEREDALQTLRAELIGIVRSEDYADGMEEGG